MDEGDAPARTRMRMGICIGRRAMGRPAGMTYADAPLRGADFVELLLKVAYPALCLDSGYLSVSAYGDALCTPASSNHRSISETHCYLQRNQQFHTYSVFPLQKYLCIALPSVCASLRCFIREPVSPALMGQEASAENFDDFFLVICKGSQPSVLADPALFL